MAGDRLERFGDRLYEWTERRYKGRLPDPHTLDEETYVATYVAMRMQSWVTQLAILTSLLVMALAWLDYLISPALMWKLLPVRLVTTAGMFATGFINLQRLSIPFQFKILCGGCTVVNIGIMILGFSFSEHHFAYFQGLHLMIVGTLCFIPLSFRHCLMLLGLLFVEYWLPISLWWSGAAPPMLTTLFIYASTCLIALAGNIVMTRMFIMRIRSDYRLARMYGERTRQLKLTDEMLNKIIQNAPEGLVIFSGSHIRVSNKAAFAMYQVENEEQLEAIIKEIIDSEPDETFMEKRMVQNGKPVFIEVSVSRAKIDHETFTFTFHRDVTGRRKLQEKLLHSQKVQAAAELIGGIAHDFKNVLANMQLAFSIIRTENELTKSTQDIIESSEHDIVHAENILREMLNFGRQRSVNLKPMDLRSSVIAALKTNARRGLSLIDQDLAISDPLPIIGDETHLLQALTNIIINAIESMPNGGKLSIVGGTVAGRVVQEQFQQNGNDQYIHLKISDTGVGIPKEMREHIFEPFVTGKEWGTGLGLMMVYNIVKEHGGYIHVKSEENAGTEVSLYFPRYSSEWHRDA